MPGLNCENIYSLMAETLIGPLQENRACDVIAVQIQCLPAGGHNCRRDTSGPCLLVSFVDGGRKEVVFEYDGVEETAGTRQGRDESRGHSFCPPFIKGSLLDTVLAWNLAILLRLATCGAARQPADWGEGDFTS